MLTVKQIVDSRKRADYKFLLKKDKVKSKKIKYSIKYEHYESYGEFDLLDDDNPEYYNLEDSIKEYFPPLPEFSLKVVTDILDLTGLFEVDQYNYNQEDKTLYIYLKLVK